MAFTSDKDGQENIFNLKGLVYPCILLIIFTRFGLNCSIKNRLLYTVQAISFCNISKYILFPDFEIYLQNLNPSKYYILKMGSGKFDYYQYFK